MVAIRVKERESIEQAIRRFKRIVERAQIIAKSKERQYYIPPSKEKLLRKKKEEKRRRKREMRDKDEHGGRRH